MYHHKRERTAEKFLQSKVTAAVVFSNANGSME